MGGPDWLMTVLPTAVALAELAWVEGLPVTPLWATPPGWALVGPAVTEVETPWAKAPALARRTWASAICGAVALDFDIEVVFERQGDGILEGEIEPSGAQQHFEAAGVGEADGRDLGHPVAAGEPGERSVGCGNLMGVLRDGGGDEQVDTQNRNEGLIAMHGFLNGIVGVCDAASRNHTRVIPQDGRVS